MKGTRHNAGGTGSRSRPTTVGKRSTVGWTALRLGNIKRFKRYVHSPFLLAGNDLRRLFGRGQSGPRRSGDSAVLDDQILRATPDFTAALHV